MVGELHQLCGIRRDQAKVSPTLSDHIDIKQNANATSVIALSKLYDLKDPRLQNIQVKGDLIPNTDGRIMTRSRARQSKRSFPRTLFASPSHFEDLLFSNSVNITPSVVPSGISPPPAAPPLSHILNAILPVTAAGGG